MECLACSRMQQKNYIRPVFAARQGDVTADGINMEGSDAQEEQP